MDHKRVFGYWTLISYPLSNKISKKIKIMPKYDETKRNDEKNTQIWWNQKEWWKEPTKLQF